MTYSSSLALGRAQYSGAHNRNSISFRVKAKSLGPVSNTIILIVLVCLLGLLYLSQVTETNVYGFRLNSLEQQQASLKNENANLEVASAQLQSVGQAQNSVVAKNMVTITPSASAIN